MVNHEIRQAAKDAGLRLWEVADALGMQDYALSRKLRHELQPDEKARVLAAIAELGAGGAGNG